MNAFSGQNRFLIPKNCYSNINELQLLTLLERRDGLAVRVLAFHQCGPGPISRPNVISGLSLLVLYSAMRGFSPQVL